MSALATRTRVLLLVRHVGNRERLHGWAEEVLGAAVVDSVDGPVDLVIADAAAFVADRAEIDRLRAEAGPVFLPCLLVCAPREAARVSREVWRSADDIVITPIRPEELEIRVERLVQQRAQALAVEASRAELARSNVDLERFAFVAAHELVAPLSIVTGAVQTVASRFVDGDATARAVLAAAVDGCQRMQALIENILDLSRAGRATAGEDVDVGALVRDVCEELRARLAQAGATVSYDGLPTVRADPAQLRLVFRNLIANAVKFRSPEVAPLIEVRAVRSEDEWEFCVSDNGVGIASADRERVFDLFTRSSAQTAVPGTGIGLAICHRIVDRLGGRIWIEPGAGSGTSFCFTVPVAP